MFAWFRQLLTPVPSLPLTWRAQWVLHTALHRARERGLARAGTDDLLYGLARTDEGVGRAILSHLRDTVEDLISPGEEPIATSQRPPAISGGRWDNHVGAVLRFAAAEAVGAAHRYVGTEHWSSACCGMWLVTPAACYEIVGHRFKRREEKCERSSGSRPNHPLQLIRPALWLFEPHSPASRLGG